MINSTRNRPARPATEKQINFIKSLIENRDHGWGRTELDQLTADIEGGRMTAKFASRVIDTFLAAPKKARKAAPAADVAEGYYTKDGQIAKVQLNLAGTNKYAKRLVLDFGITEEGEERVVDARWLYEAGLIGQIYQMGWTPLTEEQAAEFGRLYGWCGICGRRLTNEESIERGIGPVCFGKVFG